MPSSLHFLCRSSLTPFHLLRYFQNFTQLPTLSENLLSSLDPTKSLSYITNFHYTNYIVLTVRVHNIFIHRLKIPLSRGKFFYLFSYSQRENISLIVLLDISVTSIIAIDKYVRLHRSTSLPLDGTVNHCGALGYGLKPSSSFDILELRKLLP